MLDLVERGVTVRVLRHGKAIAEIIPVGAREKADGYADESAERCRMIGVHGAKLIKDGMRVFGGTL